MQFCIIYVAHTPPLCKIVKWVPGVLIRGVNLPGSEADPSPHLRSRMRETYLTPHMSLWRVAYVSTRKTFTSTFM